MPVIINEVEVLEPAPQQTTAPVKPAATAPVLTAHQLRQLLRDLDHRRARLVAD